MMLRQLLLRRFWSDGFGVPHIFLFGFDVSAELGVFRVASFAAVNPVMAVPANRSNALRIVGASIGEPVDVMDLEIWLPRLSTPKFGLGSAIFANALRSLERISDNQRASLEDLAFGRRFARNFLRRPVGLRAQVVHFEIKKFLGSIFDRTAWRIANRSELKNDLAGLFAVHPRFLRMVAVVPPGSFISVLATTLDEQNELVTQADVVPDQGVVVVPRAKQLEALSSPLAIVAKASVFHESVAVAVILQFPIRYNNDDFLIVIFADALYPITAVLGFYCGSACENLSYISRHLTVQLLSTWITYGWSGAVDILLRSGK